MIASATPEQYRRAVETVLASGEVDALIVIYIPVGLAETEAVTARDARRRGRRAQAGAAGQAGARLPDGRAKARARSSTCGAETDPCLRLSRSGRPACWARSPPTPSGGPSRPA